MSAYKTPEFKRLEREWYETLRQEGFDDAEDSERNWGGDRPLKSWHSFRFNAPLKERDASAYYDQAKELLNTFEFKSELHRQIWELHCRGFSKRKIEVAIGNHENGVKREMIGIIIQRIRKEIR